MIRRGMRERWRVEGRSECEVKHEGSPEREATRFARMRQDCLEGGRTLLAAIAERLGCFVVGYRGSLMGGKGRRCFL